MDINVNNLDLGYEQSKELNLLVKKDGELLLNNLYTNITNLKLHWIGSDATLHINNLITVYEALGALLTDAKKITADVGNRMIAIQRVRNANGGGGKVGDELSDEAPSSQVIAKCAETTEYNVDLKASEDYSLLVDECEQFSDFVNNFDKEKEALFDNWVAGVNRDSAVSNFEKFKSNSETYNKYLLDAKNNLDIAIQNFSKIQ